jgi:hypothetical protein
VAVTSPHGLQHHSGEGSALTRVAAQLRAGHSPTDDSLADELGDEVRPRLQALLHKVWLTVDAERSLTLSRVAQAARSSRRDVGGAGA